MVVVDEESLLSEILNPKEDIQEFNLINLTEKKKLGSVKEVHISDKKGKKFIFPGPFNLEIVGDTLMLSVK